MDYKALNKQEKVIVAEMLRGVIGNVRPKHQFTRKVDGKPTQFLCTRIRISWMHETVSVYYKPVGNGTTEYMIGLPFRQPLPENIKLKLPPPNKQQGIAERIQQKTPIPTDIPSFIIWLKDADAHELLHEDNLTRTQHETALRVIGRITGMLETIIKKQENKNHDN